MAFKDMREFLAKLDEIGQLKHVKAPINVAQGTNELQSLMRLLAETSGPGLMGDFDHRQTREISKQDNFRQSWLNLLKPFERFV